MTPQSFDTLQDAEKFQISLIRQASIAKRISCTRSLSQTVIQLSRRAISRANPGLSEDELNLIIVEYHYGKKLANHLEKYLRNRNIS